MRIAMNLLLLAPVLAATPARAEVHDSTPAGFAVRATATVPVSAEETWNELLDPADWWDGAHTFSASAANLSIDPRGGGCFCELLPNAEDAQGAPRGGVQHMQVLYLETPRVLRMSGALGPLQSEAVVGTLTFILKPDGAGTRINAEYVVGGYMRVPTEKMAPMVDAVIGEQVARLAAKLGGTVAPSAPKRESAPAEREAGNKSDKPVIIGR